MTDAFIMRADAALRRSPSAVLVFGLVFCLCGSVGSLLIGLIAPNKAIRSIDDLIYRSIDAQMDEAWAKGNHFIDDPLDECADPCRITRNEGGKLVVFRFAARTLATRKHGGAVIDGNCASACAMFADLARPRVCITPRAIFLFHMSSNESDPPESADIGAWVVLHGGYPSNKSGDLLAMMWPETASFWPRCSGQPGELVSEP